MAMQIGPEQEGTFLETIREKGLGSFMWLHLHYKYRKAQENKSHHVYIGNNTKWKGMDLIGGNPHSGADKIIS